MTKTNDKAGKRNSHARQAMYLQDRVVDEVRIAQIAERSGVDYDRIASFLRDLKGGGFSKESLEIAWDLAGVLLVEAVELRDRHLIYNLIMEIIKRKEPKQAHVKTETTVDHKILHLVKEIEDTDIENLISRRNAITVGHGKARPVRAIPDRRGTGKEES